MFQLSASSHFKRKYKKLIKRNNKLEERFDIAFFLLMENPMQKKLRSHKIIARDSKLAFSSKVTADLRIIWRYVEDSPEHDVDILDLIDIGGHEGAKKVYQ